MDKIEINGETYVKYNGADMTPPLDTNHVIVIAQRGWIFIGHQNLEVEDKIQLLDASVVRSWSNGRGIGGLTKEEYKSEYTLDQVGQIEFPKDGVIAIIKVEW